MADPLTRCVNCGAPVHVGSQACRYCGAAYPGADAKAGPPSEVAEAIDRIRIRLGDPSGLLAYLAESLGRLGPQTVRSHRGLFGGSINRLELKLGQIHYDIRRQGSGCVVRRQAVASDMAVGMEDTVPASRWPELLALDVARAADQGGLGWRAVSSILP
ncbi:MAG TPA: zinc ribbon domain-containing protein [Candidatus Dormibacteraeota bacterium]|jgi:hypothetical protein|nr:zinc ribbon domain-containing protein [Candidatus Dormibacteraeota bacterium]